VRYRTREGAAAASRISQLVPRAAYTAATGLVGGSRVKSADRTTVYDYLTNEGCMAGSPQAMPLHAGRSSDRRKFRRC
jgi:hypothetical protein